MSSKLSDLIRSSSVEANRVWGQGERSPTDIGGPSYRPYVDAHFKGKHGHRKRPRTARQSRPLPSRGGQKRFAELGSEPVGAND